MSTRGSARWTLAWAAALSLGIAASLQAQDTTRTRTDTTRTVKTTTTTKVTSQKRIPVTKKEVGGEVTINDSIARADSIARVEALRIEQLRQDSINNAAKMRQDSINGAARAHQDSIDRARQDSINAVERARQDSIARADSIASAEQSRRSHIKISNGFYIGFAAGSAKPLGDFEDLGYGSGFNVTVPIGWQKPNQLLGFRLDLGYNSFNGTSFTTLSTGAPASPVVLSNPDPKVYSAVANATLRFPLTENRMTGIYFVGGGGLYMFRNFGRGSALGSFLGNDVLDPDATANKSTLNKWGLNGGAGLDFGIGKAALFLETRWTNVYTGHGENAEIDNLLGARKNNLQWMPIVLGIKFH